jgi:hypothetical protein
MNLQQDLPIAEGPLSKVEVDGLVRAKEMGDEVCPFYVDILPRLSTLQVRLKWFQCSPVADRYYAIQTTQQHLDHVIMLCRQW